MASIELQNVTKRYADGTHAVRDVTLHVEDGEFMILIGPSGCGKSTALRMVAGLEPITAGEVQIDGRVVNRLAPKDRDIAMVFQNYALYPHMTVRKNTGFALRMAGMGRAEIGQRVDAAGRMLDLLEHMDRRPGQLSGGQRQRVAMGRAIVREPKAFLLDEPLSNLDAKLRVHMRTELARLHAELKTTTIYVTHDQTEAMTLGDRIAVMRDGEVQQVGTPADVYSRPANLFVAGFIGSPPMNLLRGTRNELTVRSPFGELRLEPRDGAAARGSGDIVLGVRSEHISDARALDPAEQAERLVVRGHVALVERMGSHNLAYVEVDDEAGDAVVARLSRSRDIDPGDVMRLAVAPDDVHVFDATTGVSLGYRIRPGAAIGSSS